ncbi:hypothetical protein ABEB36_004701 [Hypothenemus hampei]|uniref:Uncharacterized protein n=1 Tax=Hypothenemus hampei TaxID=57062 RepID=A0ABD1F451_HYPHA
MIVPNYCCYSSRFTMYEHRAEAGPLHPPYLINNLGEVEVRTIDQRHPENPKITDYA